MVTTIRDTHRDSAIESVLNNNRIAFLTIDSYQRVVSANTYCKTILGTPGFSLIGKSFTEYLASESYLYFADEFSRVMKKGVPAELNITIPTRHGKKMTVLALMTRVEDIGSKQMSLILIDMSKQKNVVSELEKAKGYLERLANNDALTGLSNRMRFMEVLRSTLLRSRKAKRKVALLYFDLDGFKKINDHFGHHAGDAVLCEIANRLRSRTREEGRLARLGGDEFAMMIEFSGEITVVQDEADRILEIVKAPIHLQSASVDLMSSIGICVYPDSASTPEVLVQQADASMYEAKKMGGDRARFFTTELFYELVRRTKLERGFATGLEQSQFSLKYQPIVSVNDSEIHYYEALLRWKHPEYGNVSPGEFVPLAERTGDILKLGYWVLQNACKFIQEQAESGNDIRLSINLSPVQFADAQLVNCIKNCFSEYDVDPTQVEFEITESCIFNDSQQKLNATEKLVAMGCKLSIDDFGTGYSHFSRLINIPASKLKIDRSLIKNITSCASSLSVVKGIIAMAHDLGMSVVSEGVETTEQINLLSEMRCNYLQGWALYAPFSEDEIQGKIEQRIAC